MHPLTGMAETITAPSALKNIDKPRIIEAKNKTKGFLMNCIKNPFRFGGDGGIRTHGPLRIKRFRVVLVMTTSIRLH